MSDLNDWWNSRRADGLKVFLGLLVLGAAMSAAMALGAGAPIGVKPDCSAFTVNQYQAGDVPVACAEEQ